MSTEEYIFRMSSSNNIVKLNVINQLDALSEFHRYFHGAVGATIDSAFWIHILVIVHTRDNSVKRC